MVFRRIDCTCVDKTQQRQCRRRRGFSLLRPLSEHLFSLYPQDVTAPSRTASAEMEDGPATADGPPLASLHVVIICMLAGRAFLADRLNLPV